jgi:hypothetical protein
MSVALAIHHATRPRRVISSPVTRPVLPHFNTYFKIGTIFGKKLLNVKCVLIFSKNLYPKHFSFQKEFSENLS